MTALKLTEAALNDWKQSTGDDMEDTEKLLEDSEKLSPEPNQYEKIKKQEEPQFSEIEQKALDMGWRPKEEWKGPDDEWTNPKDYVKFGEVMQANRNLHSKIDHMQQQFDDRIKNLQTFHQQSLNAQIDKLKAERDHAASEADMESYKRANDQIDKLMDSPRAQPQQPNQQDMMNNIVNHPTTQDFIIKNPWIQGQSAKAVYGQKIFSDWLQTNMNNPNAILEDGLKTVLESVNREFPQKNPNRSNAQNMAERGNGPIKSSQKQTLTMDKLTQEEMLIWHEMGDRWESQEDFLQAVIDSRTEN